MTSFLDSLQLILVLRLPMLKFKLANFSWMLKEYKELED